MKYNFDIRSAARRVYLKCFCPGAPSSASGFYQGRSPRGGVIEYDAVARQRHNAAARPIRLHDTGALADTAEGAAALKIMRGESGEDDYLRRGARLIIACRRNEA